MNWTMDNEETLNRVADLLGDTKMVCHRIDHIHTCVQLMVEHVEDDGIRDELRRLNSYMDFLDGFEVVQNSFKRMYDMLKERED